MNRITKIVALFKLKLIFIWNNFINKQRERLSSIYYTYPYQGHLLLVSSYIPDSDGAASIHDKV